MALNVISSWDEVPLFDGEQAEAVFWSENQVELRLMDGATAAAAEQSESVTITLRIDPRMLGRIKRLARERYLNYQSMIKQWLSERMDKELKDR
jgi:predicted DNA binding CopG/RHH family protein